MFSFKSHTFLYFDRFGKIWICVSLLRILLCLYNIQWREMSSEVEDVCNFNTLVWFYVAAVFTTLQPSNQHIRIQLVFRHLKYRCVCVIIAYIYN